MSSQMDSGEELTREEFVRRFTARMIARVGPTDADGDPVEDYAVTVAETYWEDAEQRADGPEECADCDISYWEDE